MGEQRKGDGKVTSVVEAKSKLGHGFRRVAGEHTGGITDTTAWQAEKNLAKNPKPPSKFSMDLLFQANPRSYEIYHEVGMSDEQIYDILSKL